MLQPMPIHDYLTGLLVAVAQSIKELPPGPCDRDTWSRAMDRLMPYCGDQCLALAEYDGGGDPD